MAFGLRRVAREELAAGGAVRPRRLEVAALGDPAVQLVAVEEVVAAVDQRRRAAGLEFQKGGAVAFGRARGVHDPGIRADAADPAADGPRDLDLVHDLVEGDAAAAIRVELLRPTRPVQEIRVVETEDRGEAPHLAAGHHLADAPDVGIEAVRVADDQMGVGPVRGRDDAVAIGKGEGHRLFDEDVLAAGQRRRRLVGVILVRRGDIDRLDAVVVAQRVEGLVGRGPEIRREGLARTRQRVGAGNQGEIRMDAGGADHHRAREPEARDAETDAP